MIEKKIYNFCSFVWKFMNSNNSCSSYEFRVICQPKAYNLQTSTLSNLPGKMNDRVASPPINVIY